MLMHDLEVLCNEPWCCICVGNLTCSFHMLHSWPTQFYVGPPTISGYASALDTKPVIRVIFLKLRFMHHLLNK